MTRAGRTDGFSLVEVVVAGLILIVLLGMLANFLVEQQALNDRTQARNEAQDKARVAMQIVVQDLQLSGAQYYVDANGDIRAQLGDCTTVSGQETCFVAADEELADDFGSVYVTTTRGDAGSGFADACRRVFYALEGSDLLRADAVTDCAAPGTADPASADADAAFADVTTNLLAPNIEAFNVVYRCSNGAWVDSYPTAACPVGTSYLRSAVVSIYASSERQFTNAAADSFDVVVAAADGTSTATRTVQCPADRTCLGLTQEVLLPNLKK